MHAKKIVFRAIEKMNHEDRKENYGSTERELCGLYIAKPVRIAFAEKLKALNPKMKPSRAVQEFMEAYLEEQAE